MGAHEEPRQRVFFEGQVYNACVLLVSLVQRAKEGIILIDGYVDAGTLNILAKKAEGVASTIWTHPKAKLTERDVEAFTAQYPELTVHHASSFHDRFLILDGTYGHLVGASLKDAGRRSFATTRIEDRSIMAVLSKLAQQCRCDEPAEVRAPPSHATPPMGCLESLYIAKSRPASLLIGTLVLVAGAGFEPTTSGL